MSDLSEQEIQEKLKVSRGFLQRQQLLKSLWKLRNRHRDDPKKAHAPHAA